MDSAKLGQALNETVDDWTWEGQQDWTHPVSHGPIVPPPDVAKRKRLLEDTSERRKKYPIARGLLDYFPDACAAVAEVSWEGNEKHNPGQEIHWARGKSMDHADCIGRHLVERGGFDGPIRHSAALAWRALALLQEELEAEYGLATPRGAKDGGS
jgi:hypothetical protein